MRMQSLRSRTSQESSSSHRLFSIYLTRCSQEKLRESRRLERLPPVADLEERKSSYCGAGGRGWSAKLHLVPSPLRKVTSLMAQTVRHLPTMQETWVPSLGWEYPLEEEMATHSSILALKMPRTEEPSRKNSEPRLLAILHHWGRTGLLTMWHSWDPGKQPLPNRLNRATETAILCPIPRGW